MKSFNDLAEHLDDAASAWERTRAEVDTELLDILNLMRRDDHDETYDRLLVLYENW